MTPDGRGFSRNMSRYGHITEAELREAIIRAPREQPVLETVRQLVANKPYS